MYFIKTISQTLDLHPSYFTPAASSYIRQLLHKTVEGTCTGKLGYIVAITKIYGIRETDRQLSEQEAAEEEEEMRDNPLRGAIVGSGAGSGGSAQFKVKYQAIVFRPFKGEVADGVVTSVNKMGVFADVGPLTCFISTHLIPADFQFDPNANPPCFSSSEESLTIQKGTKIRLKLVGTRVDATEIFAIGTIKEDYLGPIP